ncbi:MAG TPA: TetR family transcriptional regulator [Solirubrobacteraceae bacterium]|nr:TetR family transcriptional regulator [Solirubrobacteraceae bacterium]
MSRRADRSAAPGGSDREPTPDAPASAPAPAPARRTLPHGTHGLSPAFVARDQRARIQLATLELVAANGYLASTVAEVCARAQVSSKTFYEQFIDKQDAFLTAAQSALDQALELCDQAVAAAPTWPDSVWDGLATLLERAAAHPSQLRAVVVELPAAGPLALELLQESLDVFAQFLDPGFELAPAGVVPPLVRETIAGGVLELIYRHTLAQAAETLPEILPELARFALTPFLGPAGAQAWVDRRQTR